MKPKLINFTKARARKLKADILYQYCRLEMGMGAKDAKSFVRTYDELLRLTEDPTRTIIMDAIKEK